ncbi:MAG: cbb3-type cytochrome c oxidase subunit I, partial [Anaerolineae bacterium]|nr:cbb3-type cytochrome c oxidase subunit I [Anaerolineae bacterium]
MPHLSQYFVKSALIQLALGFTIGGLILASKATTSISAKVWVWFPAHITLLLNGWLVQLAIGVAYWILPRISGSERGRRRWAWASFFALQTGLGLAILSLLQIGWPPAARFFAAGVCFQALAIILFVFHAWPRVRAAIVQGVEVRLP